MSDLPFLAPGTILLLSFTDMCYHAAGVPERDGLRALAPLVHFAAGAQEQTKYLGMILSFHVNPKYSLASYDILWNGAIIPCRSNCYTMAQHYKEL